MEPLPDYWHSRGYLPHFEHPEAIQHVTVHLADSLPKSAVREMEINLNSLPPEKRSVERRRKLEALTDAGHGSCLLRHPAIARIVQDCLLYFDEERYFLLSWVVMPNHFHVLFERERIWEVRGIVASWKKFTARKIRDYLRSSTGWGCGLRQGGDANQEIGGPGLTAPVWHREYRDRYIRDENHLRQTIEYIHQNPVVARLAQTAEDWTWSSAAYRDRQSPDSHPS